MAGITEEEAKIKWCCQTFTNCGDDGEGLNTCAGSECMAWRISQKEIKTAIQIIEPLSENIEKEIKPQPELGYCGLAGIPNI